jgi:hypothetical protein
MQNIIVRRMISGLVLKSRTWEHLVMHPRLDVRPGPPKASSSVTAPQGFTCQPGRPSLALAAGFPSLQEKLPFHEAPDLGFYKTGIKRVQLSDADETPSDQARSLGGSSIDQERNHGEKRSVTKSLLAEMRCLRQHSEVRLSPS